MRMLSPVIPSGNFASAVAGGIGDGVRRVIVVEVGTTSTEAVLATVVEGCESAGTLDKAGGTSVGGAAVGVGAGGGV
jgi:hypothetical protein